MSDYIIDTEPITLSGSLIQAKPQVTSLIVVDGFDEKEILKYAGSLEKESKHILAKSIVQYAKDVGIVLDKVEKFNSITDSGIVGIVNKKNIIIGDEELLRRAGIHTKDISKEVQLLLGKGNRVVFMAVNSRCCAVFGIEDSIEN